MIGFFKRLLCSHDWIIGRAAGIDASHQLRWPNMHNRVCANCDKHELWADKADEEYERLQALKGRLIRFKDPAEIMNKIEEQFEGSDE